MTEIKIVKLFNDSRVIACFDGEKMIGTFKTVQIRFLDLVNGKYRQVNAENIDEIAEYFLKVIKKKYEGIDFTGFVDFCGKYDAEKDIFYKQDSCHDIIYRRDGSREMFYIGE